jgi:hypothetical protein
VRNQRLNAPQETLQLKPGRSGLVSSAHLHGDAVRGTPWPVDVAGREATVNACGVVVVMLQGHSWAPTPSNGSMVNVGTIPAVPSPASSLLVGGKARRRLMRKQARMPWWGHGIPVVDLPYLADVTTTGAAVSSGARQGGPARRLPWTPWITESAMLDRTRVTSGFQLWNGVNLGVRAGRSTVAGERL